MLNFEITDWWEWIFVACLIILNSDLMLRMFSIIWLHFGSKSKVFPYITDTFDFLTMKLIMMQMIKVWWTDLSCFPFRCRCRSGLLHLWLPNPEHSARRARRYLCSHHGLSSGWPTHRSVSVFTLTSTCSVFCEISDAAKDLLALICEEKRPFNKITKVKSFTSSVCLIFKASPPVSPGPAFNLFLRLCDFKLGPFVVNKYTSPGVTTSTQSVFWSSLKDLWIQKKAVEIVALHFELYFFPPCFVRYTIEIKRSASKLRFVTNFMMSVSIPWYLNQTPVARIQPR